MTAPKAPPSARDAAASTQARILAYLKEHQVASAVDLAYAWGMTRADMRYHLSALLKEGKIELLPRDPQKTSGRGRPVQYYRLSPRAHTGNLPALCSALLLRLLAQSAPEEREEVLRSLAGDLAQGFTPSTNPTRRYNDVVAFLNQADYHARWEATAQGPKVLLRSCPYAAILHNHPELCQLDHHLLEKLLQAPLKRIARMDLETGTPPACVFIAQKP